MNFLLVVGLAVWVAAGLCIGVTLIEKSALNFKLLKCLIICGPGCWVLLVISLIAVLGMYITDEMLKWINN